MRTTLISLLLCSLGGLAAWWVFIRPPLGMRDVAAADPVVRAFREQFPSCDEGIMYSTGVYGHPTWGSKALIGERYILTMQIPFVLNRGNAKGLAEAKFFLREVTKVQILDDGRYQISYGQSWSFGPAEWKEFCRGSANVARFDPRANEKPGVPRLRDCWKAG